MKQQITTITPNLDNPPIAPKSSVNPTDVPIDSTNLKMSPTLLMKSPRKKLIQIGKHPQKMLRMRMKKNLMTSNMIKM
jgi:hypothetical protein